MLFARLLGHLHRLVEAMMRVHEVPHLEPIIRAGIVWKFGPDTRLKAGWHTYAIDFLTPNDAVAFGCEPRPADPLVLATFLSTNKLHGVYAGLFFPIPRPRPARGCMGLYRSW